MASNTSRSRLMINYRNATDVAVGTEHGIGAAEIEEIAPTIADHHDRLAAEHGNGEQKWMDLPDDTALADEIVGFANEVQSQYEDFILVGIGGSSLGAIATIQALAHPYRNALPSDKRNGPRVFILDNPDPEKIAATLDTVNLKRTIVNVVTKSGQTAETMANFLVVRDALIQELGEEEARKHIVATTDPATGLLRQLVDQEGYRAFPVPVGVDGRQTVLSAVGMIPAAVAGIDIHGLLAGAAAMRDRCQVGRVRENPAYLLAALAWLADTRHGKPMLVTMPYADALFGIADWFRQLWAESLGKKLSLDNEVVYAGQTPIKALGAIDQHSQIQLYTEGPNDKLHQLVAVGQYRDSIAIPDPPANIPDLAYLAGGESEVINADASAAHHPGRAGSHAAGHRRRAPRQRHRHRLSASPARNDIEPGCSLAIRCARSQCLGWRCRKRCIQPTPRSTAHRRGHSTKPRFTPGRLTTSRAMP
jgi:glucose-6-phosphate isomerase